MSLTPEAEDRRRAKRGPKPAAVKLDDGKIRYAEYAEFRDSGVLHARWISMAPDEVCEYIPARRVESITRLEQERKGGN